MSHTTLRAKLKFGRPGRKSRKSSNNRNHAQRAADFEILQRIFAPVTFATADLPNPSAPHYRKELVQRLKSWQPSNLFKSIEQSIAAMKAGTNFSTAAALAAQSVQGSTGSGMGLSVPRQPYGTWIGIYTGALLAHWCARRLLGSAGLLKHLPSLPALPCSLWHRCISHHLHSFTPSPRFSLLALRFLQLLCDGMLSDLRRGFR